LARNKEKHKLARRAHKLRIIAKVNELKSGPCIDCGLSFHPAAMDFDHLGDKLGNVSRLINRASWARIEQEIAKCDLVCSNCHRIRTYNRLVNNGISD
jgi:hypothetical protein